MHLAWVRWVRWRLLLGQTSVILALRPFTAGTNLSVILALRPFTAGTNLFVILALRPFTAGTNLSVILTLRPFTAGTNLSVKLALRPFTSKLLFLHWSSWNPISLSRFYIPTEGMERAERDNDSANRFSFHLWDRHCLVINQFIMCSAFIKSRYPVLLPGYGSVWYRQKKLVNTI